MREILASLCLIVVVTTGGPLHAQSGSLSDVLDGLFSAKATDSVENTDLRYRFDLPDGYQTLDSDKLIPGAEFAAIRSQPNAVFAVFADYLGDQVSLEDFYQINISTFEAYFSQGEKHGSMKRQEAQPLELHGVAGLRWRFDVRVSGKPYQYISTVVVKNGFGYQIVGWTTIDAEIDLGQESDLFSQGFSILSEGSKPESGGRALLSNHLSLRYGYRLRARSHDWYPWTDVDDKVPNADIAALSDRGAGMVVVPVCWDKDRAPHHDALKSILLQEIGSDYDDDFISEEAVVSKNSYSGAELRGQRVIDSDDFFYKVWVTKAGTCANMLAVWVVDKPKQLDGLADPLWRGLTILGAPAPVADDEDSAARNASLINRLGLYYYNSRSYRKAFEYFSDAYDQAPRATFFTNALQALTDIEAYEEAYQWGKPNFANHENPEVQTWYAWLLSMNNQSEKAIIVYKSVFESGFRDDHDFELYLKLLAAEDSWAEFDEAYASYSKEPVSESVQRTLAKLLSTRGEHERAISILDGLEKPNRFDADLTYARIEVLNSLGKREQVLALAKQLIQKGFESAQAYYYKGHAEYGLGRFQDAKRSMLTALDFAPRNQTIKEYLRDISAALGDGDNTALLSKIEPVTLIEPFRETFHQPDLDGGHEGFDSYFVHRIRGFAYEKGKPMTTTHYRHIKILNEAGVERFGTLEMDFNPTYEKLFVNELSVLDEKGEVVGQGEPDSYYVVDKESVLASYDKTAHFPVPNVRPGHTIRAIISIQDRGPSDEFPVEQIFLSTDRPVELSALFVVGASAHEVKYETSQGLAATEVTNGFYWQRSNPTVYQWEPMLPEYEEILDWVQLGSVGRDWQEVGQAYLADIAEKLDYERVSKRANSLVKGVSDRERQIEILSHYVQREINYKALEFGKRAIIPKTARETMRDRYGDCKDHATLLYALLRSVGVEANLALVNSRSEVNPNLPNLDQFNHMIVHVLQENGELFIDATDKDSNLTRIPPRGLGSQYALVLNQSPELVAMPDYPADSNLLKIERQISLSENAPMRVTEFATFSGYLAADLRGQIRGIESSQLKERLQSWLSDQYKDAELEEYFVENVFDPDSDLSLELVYTMPNSSELWGETPIFLEREYLEQQRFSDKRFPFRRRYPFKLDSSTRLTGDSNGVQVSNDGLSAEGENQFATWRRSAAAKVDGLELTFSYQAGKGQYEADRYVEYHSFHRQLLKGIPLKFALE